MLNKKTPSKAAGTVPPRTAAATNCNAGSRSSTTRRCIGSSARQDAALLLDIGQWFCALFLMISNDSFTNLCFVTGFFMGFFAKTFWFVVVVFFLLFCLKGLACGF